MIKHFNVYVAGLVISLLGTLPLGTLNITAFQIAASKNINEAIWFVVAVVLVELIIVRLTLLGDKIINLESRFFLYIIPVAVALLLYLSISSFMALSDTTTEINTNTRLFPAIESSFILGLLLSVLNPMHIPFWMGWNRVLISRNTLKDTTASKISYVLGIGIGSIAGLMVFVLLGKNIFENYGQYSFIINLVLGLFYLGFSIYLIYLFFKKRLKLKTQ